jgi:geranylgeranyl diphosphate synthase type II
VTDVLDELARWRARVDAHLALAVRGVVAHGARTPARVADAMAHMLLAPGKRLRPLLVLASGQAARPALDDDALFAACGPACTALEMVHTYSLIHDDLPALDDDDLRRGRPTVHKQFDEATAVLAGDALLTDAFLHVARAAKNAAQQVEALALAAGSAGMVGGQHDDIELSAAGARNERTLPGIHVRKTAFLFSAACEMGALAVDADEQSRVRLREYGLALGLAFQIADDVLDVTADVARAGKGVGRDERNDVVTYVSLYGVEGAQRRALDMAAPALEIAHALSSPLLEKLARFSAQRAH